MTGAAWNMLRSYRPKDDATVHPRAPVAGQKDTMKSAFPRWFGIALAIAAIGYGAPAASAAKTITMVTTGKGSAQQWPIFIAIAKGYMAENGVTLDLVAAPSSAAAVQQIAAGSANLESGGLTDPLLAIDKGAKIAVLRVETQVAPYSLWAKGAIKSIPQLRGKLISIGGAKDLPASILSAH
jgi:NitT/TauT family transport system substrate-binding protein